MSSRTISKQAGTLIIMAAVGLLAAPALADLTNKIVLNDGYGDSGGAGHGGEFRATAVTLDFFPKSLSVDRGGQDGSFEVFCVERTEYIGFGRPYYVNINTAAVNGGAGGPNPDPISGKTAYIYNQFIDGNLSSYVYDTSATVNGSSKLDRIESANALQNVIWYMEQEVTNVNQGLNSYEQSLAALFLADANANGWDTIGDIRVMNLYEDAAATIYAQDQLVAVPAPGALMLGVVGLGLIDRFKRRLTTLR